MDAWARHAATARSAHLDEAEKNCGERTERLTAESHAGCDVLGVVEQVGLAGELLCEDEPQSGQQPRPQVIFSAQQPNACRSRPSLTSHRHNYQAWFSKWLDRLLVSVQCTVPDRPCAAPQP